MCLGLNSTKYCTFSLLTLIYLSLLTPTCTSLLTQAYPLDTSGTCLCLNTVSSQYNTNIPSQYQRQHTLSYTYISCFLSVIIIIIIIIMFFHAGICVFLVFHCLAHWRVGGRNPGPDVPDGIRTL